MLETLQQGSLCVFTTANSLEQEIWNIYILYILKKKV